jgi:hypothetical protein
MHKKDVSIHHVKLDLTNMYSEMQRMCSSEPSIPAPTEHGNSMR